MIPPDQILAEITDYTALRAALRKRAVDRRIAYTSDNAAQVAGLPDRYLNKVLGPKPSRSITELTMSPILGLLGVKLLMVEDAEMIARYAGRIDTMRERDVRSFAITRIVTREFLQKIGSKGGKTRAAVIRSKREKRDLNRERVQRFRANKKRAMVAGCQNADSSPALIAAQASP